MSQAQAAQALIHAARDALCRKVTVFSLQPVAADFSGKIKCFARNFPQRFAEQALRFAGTEVRRDIDEVDAEVNSRMHTADALLLVNAAKSAGQRRGAIAQH